MTSGVGLNILGLIIRDRFYTERAFSTELRDCYEGFGMLDIPQVLQGYKPRPLEGVWATPPFLHNGSIPNLYELLSPAYERSRTFFVGRREFDPVKVGYVTSALTKQGFIFDTRLPGNANTGHEFRAGYVPFDEQHPERVQFGVIGPELTPDERWEIIEYLKVHSDEPDGTARASGGPADTRRHPGSARTADRRRRRRKAPRHDGTEDESAEDPPADGHRIRAGVGGPRRRDDRRRARPGHHGHGGSDSCE